MRSVVLSTNYPLPRISRGKVRDIYDLGEDLLIVATDRISAFDVVMPNGIPDKGRVLNLLSAFWMERTKHIVPNHLKSTKLSDLPRALLPYAEELEGRFTIARRAKMLPVECIVRGYLSGSGYKDYLVNGTVCGIRLPPGLVESEKLPEPIFTPSTKAESGHDENITFDQVIRLFGESLAKQLRDLSLALYMFAASYALERGIIIADTKFEFGMIGDEIILCDEALTPDSSRFWPLDGYKPGRPQPSFDKQYVRDYLDSTKWNREPPAPPLPEQVVLHTSAKYKEAYKRLTGHDLPS